MPYTRRFRLFTVLWMLGALLWAQGALAGYHCPGVPPTAETTRSAQDVMPCAESMASMESMAASADEEPQSLCHAHCQTDHASADSFHPPTLASVAQLGAVLTLTAPAEVLRRPGMPWPLLRREGGPPLAISHCCFRI